MSRFSDILMEHFQSPLNRGRLTEPDLTGVAGTPGQGPYIWLTLQLDGEQVTESRFESNGCGVTIACGSILTELIQGLSVAECAALTADNIADALGGVPPDKAHCTTLAIEALQNAVTSTVIGGTP